MQTITSSMSVLPIRVESNGRRPLGGLRDSRGHNTLSAPKALNIPLTASPQDWLLYCRPGFEKECAAEILDYGGRHGVTGWANARPNAGYVLFHVIDTSTDAPATRFGARRALHDRAARCAGELAGLSLLERRS
jgi:hypothetical protein